MKVLVIEDDDAIAHGIVSSVSRTEFVADRVATLAEAETAVAYGRHELIILDLSLPDGDGLTFLSQLRAAGDHTPVIILTARDRTRERVQGLDKGADDYIAKPFDMQELLARMRAIQRRSAGRAINRVCYGPLTLIPDEKIAFVDNARVPLPVSQFRLLLYLIESRGRVITKQQMIDALYLWDDSVAENTIEVYVSQLRRTLWPEIIETIRGVGYCAPSSDRQP